ncbi:hypothetical protein GF314_16415 [bacterium]|nr:hypothetical protein [bacterium]
MATARPGEETGPEVLHRWSARNLQPVILVYTALVFLVFMAAARFLFHSPEAVKALAIGAVGFIVPLSAGLVGRREYRLLGDVLQRRPDTPRRPRDFEGVFRIGDLSHVVPTRHGFKFYRRLDEPRALRRLWKLHVSDAYSGEVHASGPDRDRVIDLLADSGVEVRRGRGRR